MVLVVMVKVKVVVMVVVVVVGNVVIPVDGAAPAVRGPPPYTGPKSEVMFRCVWEEGWCCLAPTGTLQTGPCGLSFHDNARFLDHRHCCHFPRHK